MEPNWQSDDGMVQLYLADCRDVLGELSGLNAVVTDPPYGIEFGYVGYDDTREQWYALMNEVVPAARKAAKFVVMPSCDRMSMGWWYATHQPEWMIAWYKGSPGHRSPIGFNDWEPHLCWGRPSRPMHDHFQTPCGFDDNGHPCPKPIEWAEWLVERAAEDGESVCDPFMGSGTTGVACARLNRKFIGVEREPKYFEIAKTRIQEALGMEVKRNGVTQKRMFGQDVNGVMPV